jgi:NTE family protein
MLTRTTLVLGGGGPWGIAWMTGLILGLEDQGVHPRDPQVIIESSSGAILGARLAQR